jgi:hypothetical protein
MKLRRCVLFGALWVTLLLTGCASVVAPLKESVEVENVPQDRGRSEDDLYDYNDQPFLPRAFHRIQMYEWLGPGVSEENAPKPADDFDDGLVEVNPSRFRQPGGTVLLAVNIRTSFAQNPFFFPRKLEGGLGIWIDWDYNSTFAVNEGVYNQPIDLPFEVGNMAFSQALVLIPVTVPPSFQPRQVMGQDPQNPENQTVIGMENPPIRVRVSYGFKPMQPIPPGGDEVYGEVEDHAVSMNDLAFFSDDPAAPTSVAALPPALVATFRNFLGTRLVLMRSDLGGQIISRRGVDVVDMETLIEFVVSSQGSLLDRGKQHNK